jgi:ATP-binding cassette subfamily C protein
VSGSPFALTPESRRFLAGEIRAHPWLFAATLAGGVLNALLEITGIGLVFPLLIAIVQPESIGLVPGMRQTIDYLGITSPTQLAVILAAAIAATMAFKNLYMIGFSWWQARMYAQLKSQLSRRMMRLYVMSDFRMHMEKSPSVMIRNLSFAGLVYDMYVIAAVNFTINALLAIGIAALLIMTLPGQSIFSIGLLAAGACAMFFATRDRFARIGDENNEIYRLRSILLQQAIGAIRESKVMGKERYFLDAFTGIELRSFDRQGHYNFLASLPGFGLETIIVIAMLVVVLHVVFVAQSSSTGLATVGVLAAAMFRMLPMVARMMSNLQLMSLGRPSLDLLAKEIELCEPRVRETGVLPHEKLGGWRRLELRNVSYTYPNGTVALRNVNIAIHRNEFVGITGPSGSGKTTLMMLILGLIEPTEGEIFVDGKSFSDPDTVRRWQNGIGYVPQGLFLVDGTLAENVAFGDPKPDLDKVQRAVEAAQLMDYVRDKEAGLLEPLGEYGERLSGGQKQRVVIARALYRDPELIAFDEATATLDAVAERALTDFLLRFKSEKTFLGIAHRLTTIKHCDKILYLEKGEVGGFEAFDELKAQNQNFRTLAALANL